MKHITTNSVVGWSVNHSDLCEVNNCMLQMKTMGKIDELL